MRTTLSCLLALVLWTFAASQSSDDAAFEGIDDPRVLPLLKSVHGKSQRWNVPPVDGRFLYDLVLERGYKRGLEIGTSNGYSTLWLGLAFRRTGGQIVTLEIDTERAAEARKHFLQAGLVDLVQLRVGDAFQEIPKLEGTFDFVFIDAWKQDYKKFLDLVYPRVSKGGVVTAHNVLSHASGMEEFLGWIQDHPGLETTIHRTSPSGISVSFKLE